MVRRSLHTREKRWCTTNLPETVGKSQWFDRVGNRHRKRIAGRPTARDDPEFGKLVRSVSSSAEPFDRKAFSQTNECGNVFNDDCRMVQFSIFKCTTIISHIYVTNMKTQCYFEGHRQGLFSLDKHCFQWGWRETSLQKRLTIIGSFLKTICLRSVPSEIIGSNQNKRR